ncbi:WxL domain-containing protein [Vagococcus salmoninarum]|uniref:Cell surface protein n=1 Tax=Vagococcus salmoninarum TaxID=2739 RepID=A0A429ZW14_9ENTE|nr:WxL domain-containing protein [Vagococcus salmoninarum]RST97967.1 cell surface protein [Vagococcus salmoninarum]
MKKITLGLSTLLVSGAVLSATLVEAGETGAEYKSNGSVFFEPNTDPVDPVDPTDPEIPVDPVDPTDPEGPNPGTDGPLSIDYASSLDFGKNKITNKNEVYFANAQTFKGDHEGEFRGNYVQVSDNRGTNAGWTLTVSQKGQFKNDAAKEYKVLTGTSIKFTQPKANSNMIESVKAPAVSEFELDPNGAASLVMAAAEGSGVGTWVDYFGTAEEMTVNGEVIQKNKAITLSVPGSTPKEAVEYRTTLVWTLTDTPGGEVK